MDTCTFMHSQSHMYVRMYVCMHVYHSLGWPSLVVRCTYIHTWIHIIIIIQILTYCTYILIHIHTSNIHAYTHMHAHGTHNYYTYNATYIHTHGYMVHIFMYWWSFYTIHSSGELIELKNIYGVHQPVEDGNFTHQLDNKQLLFHSSPVSSCLNSFLISSHIHCRSKTLLESYKRMCCTVYNVCLCVCLSACMYVCAVYRHVRYMYVC